MTLRTLISNFARFKGENPLTDGFDFDFDFCFGLMLHADGFEPCIEPGSFSPKIRI